MQPATEILLGFCCVTLFYVR